MPRALKPYKVETVAEGTQRLDVFFDRDKKVFFASLGNERVEDTDLPKALQKAHKLLITAPVYEWKPFIIIDRVGESEQRGGRWSRSGEVITTKLEFSFKRVEHAKNPIPPKKIKNEKYIDTFERSYTEDFEEECKNHGEEFAKRDRERRAQNRDLDYFSSYGRDSVIVLSYTEELWNALHRIRDAIISANQQLSFLTHQPNFEQRLMQLVQQPHVSLLPPPTVKRKR